MSEQTPLDTADEVQPAKPRKAKKEKLSARLYKGQLEYSIVPNRRRWYVISAVIVLVALGSIAIRGLNLGIEFTGGAEYRIPAANCSVEQARSTAQSVTSGSQVIATQLGDGRIRLQTAELTAEQSREMIRDLSEVCGVPQEDIASQLVGGSWGSEITKKAVTALIVFLVAVSLFLTIYYEWKYAVSALVALAHDVIITVGVYALLGLEVTPATIIGFLSILGYSLYDTVVVFDKVKENARGIDSQSRFTFSEQANKAVNQSIVRSINTSLTSLLPVLAILVVGAGFLGAGTLKDLALALFVGTLAGTYSSIFLATPFLCQIKEREPAMIALTKRVQLRRSNAEKKASERTSAASGSTGGPGASVSASDVDGGSAESDDVPRDDRPHRQRFRNQPKKQPRSKRGKP